jgi:glycolate oxidase iron-sulfur subunit
MRALQERRIPLESPDFRLHIDRCLNCRACETACPSGVQYGQLLEATRATLPPRNRTEQTLRDVVLNRVFTSPRALDVLGIATRLYQKSGAQAVVRRSGLLDRLPLNLGKLERLLPPMQGGVVNPPLPAVVRPQGRVVARIGLISGCVQDQFFRLTNAATVRVLARNGCEVVVPRRQACCGALHTHGGERETARKLARRMIATFEQTGANFYVINAAGCGSTLKEYHHLLADDPAWVDRAHAFSEKVCDVSELLATLELDRDFGTIRRRVTYQDACHLAHGQRITSQPRDLIRAIPGLELVEMNESDTCCGSAGIYNVTQFDFSMQLLERKMDNVVATKAELIVAANPGCIIQLMHGVRRRGLALEVIHPVDLLDRAYAAARD